MTRPSRWLGTLTGLLLMAASATLFAGPSRTIKGFYDAKQKQTSRAAYLRAERHLVEVRPGMSELKFLETMAMEVLARGGKPKDARMDGYLAEASVRANRSAGPGQRRLLFGYVEHGVELVMATVELSERVVVAVELTSPAAIAGETPGARREVTAEIAASPTASGDGPR